MQFESTLEYAEHLDNQDPLYTLKDKFESTHQKALDIVKDNTKVLDIGCNTGELGNLFIKKKCEVTVIDYKLNQNLLPSVLLYLEMCLHKLSLLYFLVLQ